MKTTILFKPAAAIGVLVMCIALAGCGAKDAVKDAVKDKLNDAVSQGAAAAAEEDGVEGVLNGLMTDGTEIDLGMDGEASVPDSFPSGLPQPAGDLVLALAEPGSWNLSYSISDPAAADDLAAWYESSPEYMVQDEVDAEGMHIWEFIGPQYDVNVALISAGGGPSQLIYDVTEGVE